VVTAVVRSTLQVAVTRSVEVLGSQNKTGQDLSFSPTGTVTGTATFGTAAGNAGIAVSTLGTLSVTFTDEQGRYTLYGVPSYDQDVVASYPGRTQASAAVAVPFDGTVDAPALVLGAPAAPSGRISAPPRSPGWPRTRASRCSSSARRAAGRSRQPRAPTRSRASPTGPTSSRPTAPRRARARCTRR